MMSCDVGTRRVRIHGRLNLRRAYLYARKRGTYAVVDSEKRYMHLCMYVRCVASEGHKKKAGGRIHDPGPDYPVIGGRRDGMLSRRSSDAPRSILDEMTTRVRTEGKSRAGHPAWRPFLSSRYVFTAHAFLLSLFRYHSYTYILFPFFAKQRTKKKSETRVALIILISFSS